MGVGHNLGFVGLAWRVRARDEVPFLVDLTLAVVEEEGTAVVASDGGVRG